MLYTFRKSGIAIASTLQHTNVLTLIMYSLFVLEEGEKRVWSWQISYIIWWVRKNGKKVSLKKVLSMWACMCVCMYLDKLRRIFSCGRWKMNKFIEFTQLYYFEYGTRTWADAVCLLLFFDTMCSSNCSWESTRHAMSCNAIFERKTEEKSWKVCNMVLPHGEIIFVNKCETVLESSDDVDVAGRLGKGSSIILLWVFPGPIRRCCAILTFLRIWLLLLGCYLFHHFGYWQQIWFKELLTVHLILQGDGKKENFLYARMTIMDTHCSFLTVVEILYNFTSPRMCIKIIMF